MLPNGLVHDNGGKETDDGRKEDEKKKARQINGIKIKLNTAFQGYDLEFDFKYTNEYKMKAQRRKAKGL